MYYECKCTFEMINKNNLQKKKNIHNLHSGGEMNR